MIPDSGLAAACRVFLCENDAEADAPLCIRPRSILCGIQLSMEDFCPMDEVLLQPQDGCWHQARILTCQGTALFGPLRPGAYTLTLRRGRHCLTLAVRLPPGGNVAIRCCLSARRFCWERDPFHYFFNTATGF